MKTTWNNFKDTVKEDYEFFKGRKVEKMSFFLAVIFLLSVLDAIFTLAWIKSGLAIEVNPFLIDLLEQGDFAFVGTKILLTGLGCLFLEKAKDKSTLAKSGIILIFVIYCGLTAYHCIGALQSMDHSVLPNFVDEFLVWVS